MKTRIFSTLGFLGILFLNIYWFVGKGSPLEEESAFRIVLGGFFIFILPGLIYGELIGFRSHHLLETIALAFALTLCIEICLLILTVLFNAPVSFWASSLISICLVGILVLFIQAVKKQRFTFLTTRFLGDFRNTYFGFSQILSLGLLLWLSIILYQWGEALFDISGEKFLHLAFVRLYYENPAILDHLTILPGILPGNLIHFWEYLIAAWATITNIDPLPLYFRSRAVIPLVGFSGLYFLIKNIFLKHDKTEKIFWGVLIICVGWFALVSPSSLDWVKGDPSRGLMSFMGTAHHSDTAMDMLLAISTGLALRAYWRVRLVNLFLLIGVLTAAILWHPREFFQVAVYFGIFGICVLVIGFRSRGGAKLYYKLRKWVVVLLVFFVVAGVHYGVASQFSSVNYGYSEWQIKQSALFQAIQPQNLLGLRSTFHFPFHFVLSHFETPNNLLSKEGVYNHLASNWSFFLWLFLSVGAVLTILWIGENRDKHFAIFYVLLWFLLVSWSFSMLMVIVFTYSEFYSVSPRLLYLFSFIAISLAGNLLLQKFTLRCHSIGSPRRLLFALVVALSTGFLIQVLWRSGVLQNKGVSLFCSLILIGSLCLCTTSSLGTKYQWAKPNIFVSILTFFVFFVPILGQNFKNNFINAFAYSRPTPDFFGEKNPLGISLSMIKALKHIPADSLVLVNPFGKILSNIYSAHKLVAIPKGIVKTSINSLEAYKTVERGEHPIFLSKDLRLKTVGYQPSASLSNIEGFTQRQRLVKQDGVLTSRFVVHGISGQFEFKKVKYEGGDVLQITPQGGKDIQIGIRFDNNILPMAGKSLVLSARVRFFQDGEQASFFIQDRKKEDWEKEASVISGTTWQEVFVAKQVRDDIEEIRIGINWQPKENVQMEIKDLKLYKGLLEKDYNYQAITDRYVHSTILSWLRKNKVDYLIVDKNDYPFLFPYLLKHKANYRILVHNLVSQEALIEIL